MRPFRRKTTDSRGNMSNLREELSQAISVHAAWKSRFSKFLKGAMDIDSATLGRSDACDFGKWLAEGAGAAQLGAEFAAIDAAHKTFHQRAAEVVDLQKSGSKDKAGAAVRPTGSFTQAGTAFNSIVGAARDKTR
jgi:hypothetical protein